MLHCVDDSEKATAIPVLVGPEATSTGLTAVPRPAATSVHGTVYTSRRVVPDGTEMRRVWVRISLKDFFNSIPCAYVQSLLKLNVPTAYGSLANSSLESPTDLSGSTTVTPSLISRLAPRSDDPVALKPDCSPRSGRVAPPLQ